MRYLRYLGIGLLVVLLASGCVRRVRHIPVEPPVADQNENETKSTGRASGTLYDTTRTEAKYSLKPEPYSVGSNQKDPELLGPQRTIKKTDPVVSTVTDVQTKTVTPPANKGQTSMAKSECISMIGAAKFERYSKRFGGETGAIKRCAILKKLGRG